VRLESSVSLVLKSGNINTPYKNKKGKDETAAKTHVCMEEKYAESRQGSNLYIQDLI